MIKSRMLFSHKLFASPLAAITFTVLSAMPAVCQHVVFTNFGPNQSYDQNTAWGLAWGQKDFSQFLAMSFTPSETGYLDGVDAAIYGSNTNFGGDSDIALSINLNDGGVPGAALDTLHGTAPGFPELLTETSILQPELMSGTMYWLVATVQPGFFGAWSFNNTGDTGAMDTMMANTPPYTQGGPWIESTETLGAFDISVTPEGCSLALFAAGCLPFAAIFLRRKRE